MERVEREPVEPTEQAPRGEEGGLMKRRDGAILFDPPLEERLAGNLHLGVEKQPPGRVDLVDPPEVQGLALPQNLGVTTTPPKPDAPDE